MELLEAVLIIVLGTVLGWIALELFFKAILKGIQRIYDILTKERKYSRM